MKRPDCTHINFCVRAEGNRLFKINCTRLCGWNRGRCRRLGHVGEGGLCGLVVICSFERGFSLKDFALCSFICLTSTRECHAGGEDDSKAPDLR